MRKDAEFKDFDTAVRVREVITKLAKEAIDKLRPEYKLGTVQSVDRNAMKASVIMQTDVLPVTLTIPFGMAPWDAGDLVLVDTTLGAMKVEKVVYSPKFPGGTYTRPALISPSETNPDGFISVTRELQVAPASLGTQPYYLGRWAIQDSSTIITSTGQVVIHQSVHFLIRAGGVNLFDYLATLAAPSGGWILIPAQDIWDYTFGPSFALEANIDVDDSGRSFVELRIRPISGGGWGDYPIRLEIECHGNVAKDPGYPPMITAGALATAKDAYPALADSGVIASGVGWTLTGGSSNTIIAVQYRIKNGRLSAVITIKVGTAITVPANGKITNSVFGYVPAWAIPGLPATFSTVGSGQLCSGYIANTDGAVILSAVASGSTLAANATLQIGFQYDT